MATQKLDEFQVQIITLYLYQTILRIIEEWEAISIAFRFMMRLRSSESSCCSLSA